MPRLLVQRHSGSAISHFLNGGRISVGHSSDNAIVLEDASVSAYHAEIESVGGCSTLRDLRSSNGTSVNGIPRTEAVLKDGDLISFGSVACSFQDAVQPSEPSRKKPEQSSDAATGEPAEPSHAS